MHKFAYCFWNLSKKERAMTATTTEEFPQSIRALSSTHPDTPYPVKGTSLTPIICDSRPEGVAEWFHNYHSYTQSHCGLVQAENPADQRFPRPQWHRMQRVQSKEGIYAVALYFSKPRVDLRGLSHFCKMLRHNWTHFSTISNKFKHCF